jgi:hypothetical protein
MKYLFGFWLPHQIWIPLFFFFLISISMYIVNCVFHHFKWIFVLDFMCKIFQNSKWPKIYILLDPTRMAFQTMFFCLPCKLCKISKVCNSKYKSAFINFDITFVAMTHINGTWLLDTRVLMKVCSCSWPIGHWLWSTMENKEDLNGMHLQEIWLGIDCHTKFEPIPIFKKNRFMCNVNLSFVCTLCSMAMLSYKVNEGNWCSYIKVGFY